MDGQPRLEDLVRKTLAANRHLPRRTIDFRVLDHHVVLTGVVPTCHQKQLAQDALLALDGVESVHNDLDAIY